MIARAAFGLVLVALAGTAGAQGMADLVLLAPGAEPAP